jgi:two-component system LytT family response regulator
MIRTLIIEDEDNGREILSGILSKYCPDIEIVGFATDAIEAVTKIQECTPQLVLLDIELPYGNAFDVLNKLDKINFYIIFVTAYDEYALKAIKAGAIDYILKPIDYKELIVAIDKAKSLVLSNKISEQTESLINNFSTSLQPNTLSINTPEGYVFIKEKEIIHIDAAGSYSYIYCKGNKRYMISKSLHEIEEKLNPTMFIRIHHSYIVNILLVKEYIKGRGGQVQMENGTMIDVSVRKKDDFLKMYKKV